jgi:hypothetical protein
VLALAQHAGAFAALASSCYTLGTVLRVLAVEVPAARQTWPEVDLLTLALTTLQSRLPASTARALVVWPDTLLRRDYHTITIQPLLQQQALLGLVAPQQQRLAQAMYAPWASAVVRQRTGAELPLHLPFPTPGCFLMRLGGWPASVEADAVHWLGLHQTQPMWPGDAQAMGLLFLLAAIQSPGVALFDGWGQPGETAGPLVAMLRWTSEAAMRASIEWNKHRPVECSGGPQRCTMEPDSSPPAYHCAPIA